MTRTHRWAPICKKFPMAYCTSCGLINLKNEATKWCIQHGCDYDEHPAFKAVSKTWGKNA